MAGPLETTLLARSNGPLSQDVISNAARQAVDTHPLTPEQPQVSNTPSMKPALAAMAIGDGLDLATTLYGLHHGMQEGDPIYGAHPSVARILGTKAADIGLGYLLDKKLFPNHPKIANAIGFLSGATDTAAALHNLGLMRRGG